MAEGWITRWRTSLSVLSNGRIREGVESKRGSHVAWGGEGVGRHDVDGEEVNCPQTHGKILFSRSNEVHVQPVSISRATASQNRSVCSRLRRPEVGRNCKPGSKRRSWPGKYVFISSHLVK